MKSLLLMFVGAVAWAHPLDLGLLSITPEESGVRAELRLNDELVRSLFQLSAGPLSVPTLQAKANDLSRMTFQSGPLTAGGRSCTWKDASIDLESNSVVMKAAADCAGPPEQLVWQWPFVKATGVPESFRLLVRLQGVGKEEVASADRERIEIRFDGSSRFTFGRATLMGMEHIGATPNQWKSEEGWHLPEGIDHILFVFALVLGGTALIPLLKTVTGFTVGHSITLALVATRLIHPPVRIVESLIALSIALVAYEALKGKNPQRRWKWATAFGLVHGFGFGTALLELDLTGPDLVKALVGFNLGVELGQLVILVVAVPLITLLSKTRLWSAWLRTVLTGGICAAGSYWFITRALGL